MDAALAFYRDRLGHALAWRTDTAAGLHFAESETELVLQTERPEPEADLLVTRVADVVDEWRRAGGTIAVEPFDIAIGRCAVLVDPFGNRLVIVDMTRGTLRTDVDGRVVGVDRSGC